MKLTGAILFWAAGDAGSLRHLAMLMVRAGVEVGVCEGGKSQGIPCEEGNGAHLSLAWAMKGSLEERGGRCGTEKKESKSERAHKAGTGGPCTPADREDFMGLYSVVKPGAAERRSVKREGDSFVLQRTSSVQAEQRLRRPEHDPDCSREHTPLQSGARADHPLGKVNPRP